MLTIRHFHEFGPATLGAIRDLTEAVRANLKTGVQIMKDLATLEADVANETTVEASIEALVVQLVAEINDLKTAGTDSATAARIDALATKVESNLATMQSAVVANTPAAPPADQPQQSS